MDIQEHWDKALKNTEVIRPRVQPLSTAAATHLPYIFLAESSINIGDTVVRKGEMLVEQPSIILPSDLPQFEGLDPEGQKHWNMDTLTNFLFVRGIRFPSMKYSNKTHSLDIWEGKLKAAIRHHLRELEKQENVSTGLVIGPEDCWQFSVLLFVASQVIKQAEGDIQRLLDSYKKKRPPHV